MFERIEFIVGALNEATDFFHEKGWKRGKKRGKKEGGERK